MLDRLFNFLTASPTFQFLRNTVPFDFLDDVELQQVADALIIEYYAKGAVVCTEGQSELEGLLVVQKGMLALTREGGEQEAGKRFVETGGHFGGNSLLRNAGIALYTAKAVEDTFVYILPKKHFLALCSRQQEFADYFENILGAGMSPRFNAALHRRWLSPGKTPNTSFLERTLADLLSSSTTPVCRAEELIGDVAQMLLEAEVPFSLVFDASQDEYGVLSLFDLVRHVYQEKGRLDVPVRNVVHEKPLVLAPETRLVEVMEQLTRCPQTYIATKDAQGKVTALARVEDILAAKSHSPIEFLRDLWRINLRKDFETKHKELSGLVRSMLWEGASVEGITSVVSLVSDAILARLTELAEQELGAPPCSYAVIVLGSEGRREQTLITDQDNAIVFADVDENLLPHAEEYFSKLGERLCAWLNQAGYPYCPGGNMANNSMWCQPLSVWKKYFRGWIQTPEPEAVLNSAIWFDFSLGYGSADLVDQLRAHLFGLLANNPPNFFYHLAAAALRRKPPLGFFRGLVLEEREGRRDALDLKLPAACISDFARIHALARGISKTNTLERLAVLQTEGVIDSTLHNDIHQAYILLTRLRFMSQVLTDSEGESPTTNLIVVNSISPLERRFLEEVFRLIERLQVKLREQFMGRAM